MGITQNRYGMRQSCLRKGTPGDYSRSENFFANLKEETVHWKRFQTRVKTRQKMFACIEGFYNKRRIRKRLDYLSPLQWLKCRILVFKNVMIKYLSKIVLEFHSTFQY
ncbi:MAG: IS3 family transposase [Clostridiaceae bacterium]|nr:IS3 family transposase [Clostridiaceae bacterium]